MRNSAEVAKEVIRFLTPLPREGKGSEISFLCTLCMIAQHKIRLQKRNWLALAGSKHRSSPTTLTVVLSGVCWFLKEVALHL